MKKLTIGWVYIITNPNTPALVKIGYSGYEPQKRATEITGTSPYPCVVEYAVSVNQPYSVEQGIHKSLKAYNENKEWFHCSVSQAKTAVKKYLKEKDIKIRDTIDASKAQEVTPAPVQNQQNLELPLLDYLVNIPKKIAGNWFFRNGRLGQTRQCRSPI